ncbi:MAG: TetR/AcrR family transcriptional regulator [Cyanobacteria bacterium P01_D01_bin.105]
MPKPTFFNLSDKKRQNITDLAIAEFANADYNSVSISNIVKQAKIAKGSFYQYFEDKQDLYMHIVSLAYERRIAFVQTAQQALQKEPKDFFETLRQLFRVSVQFSFQQPQLAQIINRAAYDDSPVRETVSQQARAIAQRYIYELVKKGIADGDLHPTISPDLATFVIVTTADSLKYYIPQQLKIDTQKLATAADTSADMQLVEQIFDELVQVFKRGMAQA